MRANRLLLLRLPLAFAAAATASAAFACGPPGGSVPSGSATSGSDRGGYDNGAAERAREGADAAAGEDMNTGEGGGRQRSSDSQSGPDLSHAISDLAALQSAQAAQAAQDEQAKQIAQQVGYEGDTQRMNPDWLSWYGLPWWDRVDEDTIRPPMYKDRVFPTPRPFYPSVTGTDTPEGKDRDFAAEAHEAQVQAQQAVAEMNDKAYQQSLRDAQAARDAQIAKEAALQPDTFMAPEGYGKTQAWLAWNDLPWYQRWTTPEPLAKPYDPNIKRAERAGVRD